VKAKLLSRVARLEARSEQARRSVFLVGVLTRLPSDYVGERHIVDFEERPGPEPPGANDGICRVYLSEDDANL
jgi:hypothetical protein